MKTAYELAIERMGGQSKQLNDDQKKELADIDRVYGAKVAEAKLAYEARQKSLADDQEKAQEAREQLAAELASLERKREGKKNAVRERKD